MSLSCTGIQADPSSRATGDVCFGEALSHAPYVRDEGEIVDTRTFPLTRMDRKNIHLI